MAILKTSILLEGSRTSTVEYDIKTIKNARSELEDFAIFFCCDLRNRSELFFFFAWCIFTKKFVNAFQDLDI